MAERKITVNRGLCYVVSEWLYHELGGKAAGWKPMVMYISRTVYRYDILQRRVSESTLSGTHWFLKHKSGFILDATANQFDSPPDYSKARGCGFLTKRPSAKTRKFMSHLSTSYKPRTASRTAAK